MAKKELDAEVNLIAFISLLSVLICALLLTSIWIQIGSMNVKQAIGGQPASETKKVPAVWAFLHADGKVVMRLQDAPRKRWRLRLDGKDGKPDLDELASKLEDLKKTIPEIRTALIQPKSGTVYENLIVLMDTMKKSGLIDLGVAPL